MGLYVGDAVLVSGKAGGMRGERRGQPPRARQQSSGKGNRAAPLEQGQTERLAQKDRGICMLARRWLGLSALPSWLLSGG